MQLLDINATAARLSLHPETVRRLIRAGDLPALKTGRVWKVEENQIAAYVEKLKSANPTAATSPAPTP